jgi:ABC-type transport system substrate-binding protein
VQQTRELADDDWRSTAFGRRTLLRGGLLAGAGLAAAALVGCGDDDDDDDDDDTAAVAPSDDAADDSSDDTAADDDAGDDTVAAGEGMLVQDPDLPFPHQFPEPAGSPKAGGTLRVAATFSVSTMDPSKSAAGGTITVPNMVYNRLLGMVGGPRKDPFSIELEPELAASWERTPDGGTFTFNLREDVKWQNVEPLNGRPFTAQDVKFAYDRYATEGVHQSYWANIAGTEAVDDHTLKISMSKVTADFILPLASRYQTIHPRELVDDESINEKVVGTGPMILTELEPASRVTFVKNPDYWEREVLLDGAEFALQPDVSARLAAFRVGNIDYSYALASNIRAIEALLETNPDVQINMNIIDSGGLPLGLNLSNPKFTDERVRQAMVLAIDTDLMEELVYDGLAKTLPLQPWTFVFDEEPTVESGLQGRWFGRYDPDEARKLLAAAGAEGLEFGSIYYNYGSPAIDSITEIVVQSFADVGMTMNSRHVDYTEFNSTWVPGKLEEVSTSAWRTVGFDADNYFFNQVHSESPGNRWKLNDPQVDAWAEEQQVLLDPDERREVLREMWDHFMEQAYYPPLPSSFSFEVYQPWLRGIRFGGLFGSNSSYYDWGDQIAGAWLDK